MAQPRRSRNLFYNLLKAHRHHFDPVEIVSLFEAVNEGRVEALASLVANYITTNLPEAFERREGLAAYRTNPYVLMTSASLMKLNAPAAFADFLFNSKLYMGLETSFGKSVEAAFLSQYPLGPSNKWTAPPEKTAEFAALGGLSNEERAARRVDSVWREIDSSCVVGNRRYLVSIKSGPNTINDSQVQAMTDAFRNNYTRWATQTHQTYPHVQELDVVIGLTYGTDRTTNNKEN